MQTYLFVSDVKLQATMDARVTADPAYVDEIDDALGATLPAMLAAQETACTPFDNNGDNVVGIGDLIALLARFGDSDLDMDGIWDSTDDCVGAYDTCGVCNGPGPQVLAIDTIVIRFTFVWTTTAADTARHAQPPRDAL